MNLENYETVKERKKKFYADWSDGRIIVKVWETDHLEYVICTAKCYKNQEEQEKGLPWATGNALEIRDKELSISQYGKEYASVNFSSWLENCEESAVGRCLDNAGYSGNNKCSREEMQKVQRVETKAKTKPAEGVPNVTLPKNSVDNYIKENETPNEEIPNFDEIGKPKFNPGDFIPKEYWADRGNPIYGGLRSHKNKDGYWFFVK